MGVNAVCLLHVIVYIGIYWKSPTILQDASSFAIFNCTAFFPLLLIEFDWTIVLVNCLALITTTYSSVYNGIFC